LILIDNTETIFAKYPVGHGHEIKPPI